MIVPGKVDALLYLLVLCLGATRGHRTDSLKDDLIERFYYSAEKDPGAKELAGDLEFLIIGRKVPWLEAKALCPSYDDGEDVSPDATKRPSDNAILATFQSQDEASWFAQMISESDYRYEGLWIGGSRKDNNDTWHWNSDRKMRYPELSTAQKSLVYESYPSWYTVSKGVLAKQNCLLFNRIDHDQPAFVPSKCNLPKPFVCMRFGKRKSSEKVSVVGRLKVDGQRYTLYRVNDDSSYPMLNGGGIKWKEAVFECEKRGQDLATIYTNEAAVAIADMMLKARPSMENVWLGASSPRGDDWTWLSSGSILPSRKHEVSEYPPWFKGRPRVVGNHSFRDSSGRCLILDRHHCPDRFAPAFLDLDCDRRRPFVCQDSVDQRGQVGFRNHSASLRMEGHGGDVYEFNDRPMTYGEASKYCKSRGGKIASILNAKMLSACLDRMTELSIEHLWINGRTMLNENKYWWVNDEQEIIRPEEVGSGDSWCFSEENGFLPVAKADSCLNLDSEARGSPLFYGLPCNSTQPVLCHIGGPKRPKPKQITYKPLPESVESEEATILTTTTTTTMPTTTTTTMPTTTTTTTTTTMPTTTTTTMPTTMPTTTTTTMPTTTTTTMATTIATAITMIGESSAKSTDKPERKAEVA